MRRTASIVVLLFFTSFTEKGGVEISVINDSEETFVEMTVKTGGKEFSFSTLCPGEKTKPITVDKTYWFFHTVAVTQQDTVLFTGFCLVGETPIQDGKLTVSYAIRPKQGEHRTLYANEVSYSGSAKNIGFPKFVWKEEKR